MRYIVDGMGPVVALPDPEAPWQTREYRNPLYTEAEEIGSFSEYCKGHFGWDWLSSLGERLAEGEIAVGRRIPAAASPAIAHMKDADIIRMEFSRMDRTHFYADAVITAEIELSGGSGKVLVTQWYRDRFIFRVFPGGYEMEEDAVTIYDKKDQYPGLPLSEYLIPVLSEENTEQEAEEMIRRYYPEAFMRPQPVDAMLLAERMGLTVVDVPLCAEEPLMGQAVFYRGTVRIYSGQPNEICEMEVSPGMILVNSRCGMDRIQRNTTIIHECIHHYEHDLFIWAQTLYRDDICAIGCPITENSFIVERQSPVHWAEMQARLMTYRVKMNRLQTERKIRALDEELSRKYPKADEGRHLEQMIRRLSAYFYTSKQCARKRMLELGHGRVRGVLDYVNGEYVPPYFFPEGILERNQTFTISLQEAAMEYSRNGRFRELVDSGYYVYVEGKFCQNKREYIRKARNGKLAMTEEARQHTESCCLRFEYTSDASKVRYAAGRFNREPAQSGKKHILVAPQSAAEPGQFDPQDFLKEAAWVTSVRKKIGGMDFNEALVALMKERKCTIERLEEKTMISGRTISRLRNDPAYDVTWAHVVALSVGLNLPPAISNDLLAKAGLQLRNNVAHNIYSMVLSTCYMLDIGTVNGYLIKMGLEPLTEMANAG